MADIVDTAHTITNPILGTICFIWGGRGLHRVTRFDGIVDERDGWMDGWRMDWLVGERRDIQGRILLTWINFNLSIDK